jgi:hypothetical protein
MENFYNAYSKTVNGQTYFFVKKYLSFPEFNNVPDVLAGYGMHTDFDKACKIAMVTDQKVKERLRIAAGGTESQAPIIHLSSRIINMQGKAQ